MSEGRVHQSDLGGAEIDQPIRPIKARELPGAEKSPKRAYNYWAADEFVNNSNPALRVSEPNILMHVVGPLDMFENPTSQNLNESLKKLGELWSVGTIPHTAAGQAQMETVRDRINAKIKSAKGQESLLGSPEIPQTPADWMKFVRKQLSDFESKDSVTYSPNTTWDEMLELKSSSSFKFPKALEKMQDTIANAPVPIESEGVTKMTTFKERLIAECRARQTLHNRYVQWRASGFSLTALSKGEFMANNAELEPDKLEAISSMMPQAGQTELVGDRVSKALWAYRQIAHNLPFDGLHMVPNIFREFLNPNQKKAIHDAVTTYVGKDEDAERLGFRLAHVWREAACGDNSPGDEARGVKTGDSDVTSRLSFVEQWRQAQLEHEGSAREGGPKETLKGYYPRDLLPPLLDATPYEVSSGAAVTSLAEALQTIPGHLLRKIKWHENKKAGIDGAYARSVGDAIELFVKITTYGAPKDDISVPGFQKLNKNVDDVISDAVIVESISPPGIGVGYWKSDKGRATILEEQKRKSQHSVRRGIIIGMLRSSNIGLLGGEARAQIIGAAVNAGSISYGESLLI